MTALMRGWRRVLVQVFHIRENPVFIEWAASSRFPVSGAVIRVIWGEQLASPFLRPTRAVETGGDRAKVAKVVEVCGGRSHWPAQGELHCR